MGEKKSKRGGDGAASVAGSVPGVAPVANQAAAESPAVTPPAPAAPPPMKLGLAVPDEEFFNDLF